MKSSISPLSSHTGFWMRMVSNQVSQSFARKLESSGVTVAEWVILREMYGAVATVSGVAAAMAPSQVAEITGLTRGAVSKLIERLIVKKLVTRKEDKNDKRYQVIALTIKGENLVPQLAELADKNDEEFFSELTKNERRTLNDLLKKVAQLNKINRAPIE